MTSNATVVPLTVIMVVIGLGMLELAVGCLQATRSCSAALRE